MRWEKVMNKLALKFYLAGARGYLNWLPDKEYLNILYGFRTGKKLDLNSPSTFNEKIQWLKLYDRKPIYTTLVDKCEVKKYVATLIGEKHIIPTLGVWAKYEDINFQNLPKQFVLKCTHDSGGLIICKDKTYMDFETVKKKINASLATNYFWSGREWPYKDISPRIIAEQYMEDVSISDGRIVPNEYQFWCFNGKPKFVSAIYQPHGDNIKATYDMEWNRLDFVTSRPIYDKNISKPEYFEDMLESTIKLCANHVFVRVDYMVFNSKWYFGELTKSPASGFVNWYPNNWDEILGTWLELPSKI